MQINRTFFRNTFLAGVCFLGIGLAKTVNAHDLNQTLLASNGPSATDLFLVQCYSEGGASTDYLAVRFMRRLTSANSFLNLQVIKGGVASNASVATAINVWSPWIYVGQGNGDYLMTINQTHAVNSAYRVEYHCAKSDGTHTGTGLVLIQNQ